MSDCKLTLGERIADTLLKQGKTQTDLCNEIGMKTSTLNAIITGERKNPRIETIVPIAKGLNTSLDYLLGLSDTSSVNVELKDIKRKTGLSETVLNKFIKRQLKENEIETLNLILESDIIDELLRRFKKYLHFLPNDCEYRIVPFVERPLGWDDIIDGQGITNEEYEKILLDNVACCLADIKNDSEQMYQFYIEELEVTKAQLEMLKADTERLKKEKEKSKTAFGDDIDFKVRSEAYFRSFAKDYELAYKNLKQREYALELRIEFLENKKKI